MLPVPSKIDIRTRYNATPKINVMFSLNHGSDPAVHNKPHIAHAVFWSSRIFSNLDFGESYDDQI